MPNLLNSATSLPSSSDSESEDLGNITLELAKETFLRRLQPYVEKKSNDSDFFFVDTVGMESEQMNADQKSTNSSTTKKDEEKNQRRKIDLTLHDENEVQKILSKAILQPDYDQKAIADICAKSKRREKKDRKEIRERTAGKAWDNMPAAELTDERRQDLEYLRMRKTLDPLSRYRKIDRDAFPKYFQTGRIVDNKEDYYSSRLTKKQRKRTMIEELMQDVEFVAKTRRRYDEIMSRRAGAKRRGVSLRHKGGSKRKLN